MVRRFDYYCLLGVQYSPDGLNKWEQKSIRVYPVHINDIHTFHWFPASLVHLFSCTLVYPFEILRGQNGKFRRPPTPDTVTFLPTPHILYFATPITMAMLYVSHMFQCPPHICIFGFHSTFLLIEKSLMSVPLPSKNS